MEGRELRRPSVTLSEQLAVVDSYNLGDLLKFRDEDEVRPSSAVAACAKMEASSAAGGGRTLLDIMREDHQPNGVVVGRNSGNGIKWKSFKNLLRFRCASAAWAVAATSSGRRSPLSYPELVVSVRSVSRSVSIRSSELPVPASSPPRGATVSEYSPEDADAVPAATTSAPEEHPSVVTGGEETGGESSDLGGSAEAPASAEEEEEEEQPVRVSLMALLEETDRQWASGGEASSPASSLLAAADDEVAEYVGGGILNVCCVCMVRHKGAAFIPCGHTFCRLCSRELWVSRGSCPLCNGDITEILDIF